MTKSSKTPPDSVKQRKAKGTIKRPKDQKTAKRRASQAQARKAMKMMKKGPKAKQAPKQQMKSSRGRKDTKPAKAMKAIVKAMKSMSVMKAKGRLAGSIGVLVPETTGHWMSMESWTCCGCGKEATLETPLFCQNWINHCGSDQLHVVHAGRSRECAVEFREDVQQGILSMSGGRGRQITMSIDGTDIVGIHIFLHKDRGNVVDWQLVHKSGQVGPPATRSPNAGQKETLWFLDHFHGLQFAELDEKGIVDVGVLDPPWYCEACWNQLEQYRSHQYLLPWPNYKFVRAQLEVGISLRSTLLSSLEQQIVIHPMTEAWSQRACKAVLDHGICILPSVLSREAIESWKKGCQRLHKQIEEFGFSENRGTGRFSFGTAFKKALKMEL
eukprot:s3294_g1.t1